MPCDVCIDQAKVPYEADQRCGRLGVCGQWRNYQFAGCFDLRAEAGGVKKMSNLEMIARMSEMLELAAALIRDQAALLSQHGIQTSTGNDC